MIHARVGQDFMSKLDLRGNLALYTILVVAFAVRVWSFTFGLPDFHFYTDEEHVLGNVGSLFGNVERTLCYTTYAEFYGNVVEIVCGAVFLISKVFGSSLNYQEFLAQNVFYIGRLLGVIYGTASVFCVYKIGKLLWRKEEPALFSASVFAFAFICVQNAHYAKQDSLMILFGLISFFYSIKILTIGGTGNYIRSGVFAGLSFSAHRHGFPLLFILIAAHFLKKDGGVWKKVGYRPFWIGLLISIVSFIIASPYFAYHFIEYICAVWVVHLYPYSEEVLHAGLSRYYSNFGESGLFWFARYFWSSGFSWSFSLLAILGTSVILINKVKKKTPLVSPEMLIFLVILLNGILLCNMTMRQNRWAQIPIPFLSLLSGAGLYYIYEEIRSRITNKEVRLALVATTFVLLFYSPVKSCLLFDYYIAPGRDTREITSKWILNNIDKDSTIFFDMGSFHVMHFLQRNGFTNTVGVTNSRQLNDVLAFDGDYIVLKPIYYIQAERVEPTSEEVEIFKYISEHGKLVFEASVPIFESDYFGEYRNFTDTLHDYHNVKTQLYQIPNVESIFPGAHTRKKSKTMSNLSYTPGADTPDYNALLDNATKHNVISPIPPGQIPSRERHKVTYDPIMDKTYLAEDLLEYSSTFQLVLDPQALQNRALYVPLEKQGAIYGPYRPFPRGWYIVKYDIRTDNNTLSDDIVSLTVISAGGATTFNNREVEAKEFKEENKYQGFVLPFRLRRGTRLEFILTTNKKANIWVDNIKVTQLADAEEFWKVAREAGFKLDAHSLPIAMAKPWIYSASKFEKYTSGKLVNDKDSTNDVAILNGDVWGPYKNLLKGNYTVTWRLKTDNTVRNDDICSLAVTVGGTRKLLIQKTLKGTDFSEANKYQEFSLPLSVSADTQLEYKLHYSNKSKLWFDRVKITRLGNESEFQELLENTGYILTPSGRLASALPEVYAVGEYREFTSGEIVQDTQATDGLAILNGNIWGPYKNLLKGNYTVTWRLKTDNTVRNDDICSLAVTVGGTRKLLIQKTLKGTDFSEANKYQEFSLPLSVSADTQLEYKLHYSNKSNLWFDRTEVRAK